MTTKCGVCKEAINRDLVTCFGICNRQFHARCVGMGSSHIKTINECCRLKFICELCEITSHNVILQRITKLVDSMCDFRGIIDDVNDIKQVVNKTEDDLKLLSENLDLVKSSIKENESKSNFVNSVNSVNSVPVTNKKSYADTLKCNEPVVIIVPKQKQTSLMTKNAVMQSLDPTQIPISKLRNAANGAVIIEGKAKKSAEVIKKYATERLSASYEIKITELAEPKIIVTGMYEKLSSDEIICKLKSQNIILEKSKLKVLSINGKRKFSAILEIDSKSFNSVMSTNDKTLNVGWAKCSVHEHLNIKRCFKCYGFNHIAKDCKRKKACKKCAGEHEYSECMSNEEKCVNCFYANRKFNLKLDINHAASSFNCKVFEREQNIRRKRVQYGELNESSQ